MATESTFCTNTVRMKSNNEHYFKLAFNITLGLLITGIVFLLTKSLVHIFLMLVLSFIVASALELPVHKMEYFGIGRKFATLLTLISSLLFSGVLIFVVGVMVSSEVSELFKQLGTFGEEFSRVFKTFGIHLTSDQINSYILTGRDKGIEYLKNETKSITNVIVDSLVIVFFAYYFVVDGIKLRKAAIKFFKPKNQEIVLDIWQIVIEKTGSYLIVRLILIAISSFTMGVFASLIGIPYGWALGLWFGFISQALPIIGTYLGLTLPLAVAFNHGISKGIFLIIYVIIFQLLADYIILPKIASETLELHPAIIFIAVLVGGALLGFSGIIVAIPIAATIKSVISTYVSRDDILHNHKLLHASNKRKPREKKEKK